MDKKAKLKQELFASLEKDISGLKREIKLAKYDGLKIGTIRNLKIARNILRGVYPYILSAGLIVGSGVALDFGLPFKAHDETVFEKYKIEMSNGKEQSTETSFQDIVAVNQIRVHTNWRQNADGNYERDIETFLFNSENEKNLTKEQVAEIIQNNDVEAIKSLIGKSRISKQVQKNAPLNFTKTSDDYRLVEATITGTNKKTSTLHRQTTDIVVLKTLIELLLLAIPSYFISLFRHENDYSMIGNIGETINDNQPKDRVPDLKNALALKKQNYELLGGGL